MKELHDLETFTKILTNKGYDGYFVTGEDYGDKLRESIGKFLEAHKNGTNFSLFGNRLLLRTYLEWNGNHKPYTDCVMLVKWENNSFDVERMDVERRDRYSHVLKRVEFKNLSTASVPTVKEVLSQVTEKTKEQIAPRKRGFTM